MCSRRILGHLRLLAKDRGNPKQPFKVVLDEAINSLKKIDRQATHSLSVGSFIERARDVVKLIDSWVNHQKLAELEHLVEGIHELKQVGNLQVLMDRDMCPSSRQNLINIVSRVSRYREAARFLYRTAKKLPLLRRTELMIVNLPAQVFQHPPGQNHIPDLVSVISITSTVS